LTHTNISELFGSMALPGDQVLAFFTHFVLYQLLDHPARKIIGVCCIIIRIHYLSPHHHSFKDAESALISSLSLRLELFQPFSHGAYI